MAPRSPTARWRCGLGLWILVIVASACGSAPPTASKTSRFTPAAAVGSQSPKATATECATLTCHMTKPTDAYGVPLPDDSKPHGSTGAVYDSLLATPNDFIAFYDVYLRGKGWMLDLQYS